MEIISKISRGTKMDQVYIPKQRPGMEPGTYVIVKPIEKTETIKPYYYSIKDLEPVKIGIIKRIFYIIGKLAENENIIITGSFIEKGFHFNDIDIVIITENKINEDYIKKSLENALKIKIHLIVLNSKEIKSGLQTDPLYIIMLSKCISKKRLIYKIERKFYYKILDLHLIKSNEIIYGFDFLDGNEKYRLIRNTIAILMFVEGKKLTKESVDKEIEKIFSIKIKDIKNNMIEDKKEFIRKYKEMHNKTFNKLMEGVKNGSKQKQTD